MRKYFVGMVFGLILGLSVTAYGSGMIGKVVDTTYPVFIDGQGAEMDAIVIEGVSYLPTRYIAESVGYTVAFVNEQVVLTEPVGPADVVEPAPEPVTLETPVEEVSQVERYKFRSDLFKDVTPVFYEVKDGEWYMPVGNFEDPGRVDWDGKDTVTVTMPWGNVAMFHKSDTYSPGIDGYTSHGRSLVNLTALGLKPVVSGDTVTLVRTE